MKKITAFVGSAHKRNTHKAVVQFLDHLQALGEFDSEIVTLSDYTLKACRGCRLCFDKGEEFCPLKDDRDVLMEKIMESDGVIFATPNYTFQVSGYMKLFLDRFGFVAHRPRYFGKTFTSLVTQGFSGGEKIVDYLGFVARILGFNVVKGSCITAFDPWTEKDQQKVDRMLARHAKRFQAGLARGYPAPSLFMLMGFRMGRTTIMQELDDRSYDYRYYAEKGWLKTDYFYPTRLSPIMKAAGKLFDKMTPTVRKVLSLS